MDLTKAIGYLILWKLVLVDSNGGGTPRGYRWSEWQTCTSGCSSPNMRFRICEYQNNNGVSHCTPDDQEEETVLNPETTTTNNLPVVDISTTTESAPVVETTTMNGQVVDITATNAPGVETTSMNGQAVETTGFSTTTAIETTTTIYNSSNQNTNCSCDCDKVVIWTVGSVNLTTEEAERLIAQLRQELAVNVSTLSSYVRKKTSAHDSRTSSAAMGYMGAIVLATVVVLVVGSDIISLIANLRMK